MSTAPSTDTPVESASFYRPLRPWKFSDGHVTRVRALNGPAFKLAKRMGETGEAALMYEIADHCALDCTREELDEYGHDEMTAFVAYVGRSMEEVDAYLAARAAADGAAEQETTPGEAPAAAIPIASSSATPSRSRRSATASPLPITSGSSPSTSSSLST